MVLGIRSSEDGGCTDFRLILDLKRVLIKVDLPKPLCPGEGTGRGGVGGAPGPGRGRPTGPETPDTWASPPPGTLWGGSGGYSPGPGREASDPATVRRGRTTHAAGFGPAGLAFGGHLG